MKEIDADVDTEIEEFAQRMTLWGDCLQPVWYTRDISHVNVWQWLYAETAAAASYSEDSEAFTCLRDVFLEANERLQTILYTIRNEVIKSAPSIETDITQKLQVRRPRYFGHISCMHRTEKTSVYVATWELEVKEADGPHSKDESEHRPSEGNSNNRNIEKCRTLLRLSQRV